MSDEVQPATPSPAQAPAPEVKKPGFLTSLLSSFWAKLEDVDAKVNQFVAKISDGHSTLFIALVSVAYWFVRPFFGFILLIPAKLTEVLLQALAVVVPFIINAIPYILLVGLALLLLVELVNLLKKK